MRDFATWTQARAGNDENMHFAVSSPAMAKIVLLLPNGTTLDVPLSRERLSIGRRADNDVCLPNLAVSGEHATVVTILADSFLEDLGSTNGTLVNGKPVAKHFLRDGDQIDIGRHKLMYFVDDEAIPPSGAVKMALRDAVGDLGQKVELAKPIVRNRRASPAVVRREGPPSEPAKSDESTMRITAVAGDPLRIKPAQGPVLRFLSGPRAGQKLALTREQTIIGRAGVQVAVIERSGDSFRFKPIEGEAPPVNGHPAAAEGVVLSSGDVIEILDIKLEFTTPEAPGSAAAAADAAA